MVQKNRHAKRRSVVRGGADRSLSGHRHGFSDSRKGATVSPAVVELTVERFAHGGSVVGRDGDGRVVFVRHAIAGERVRARVTGAKKNLAWAEAVEILSPSPDRVPSVWEAAGPGGVGGAELAHVSLPGQLTWKELVVRDQLRRIGGEDVAEQVGALPVDALRVRPTPLDELRTQRLGWRSRVEFVVDAAGRACMHGYRDGALVPVVDMPLAMPSLLATGVLEPDSVWRSLWRPGDRVRVVSETGVEDPRVLVAIGQDVYEADGTPAADSYLRHVIWVGQKQYSFRVRMQGFWQAHYEGAQTLAANVLEFSGVAAGDSVLELYSGAGLFSVVLADAVGQCGRVVTVEGSEDAVADAALNVADFGNVDPFVGWIDEEAVVSAVGELGVVPQCIVLDPPRAGAGRDVCERVASIGAERVVLVACDIASGARDLKALVAGGYRVADMRVWDLYPYTHHVECVFMLTRS